ncbi:DUF1631 domain-containing protein [Massilia atriviolacea]|uniref:DUF1631 family protein n=1 Tax=Massilia atriviolacea TaxID=2495579 RepID=A0A430HJJ0_9BURK|nr:DUF1631 family protein [Massilia atriviolacea]RSZ57649.1 DUF1631 family protein [Massilia atriviolacea]
MQIPKRVFQLAKQPALSGFRVLAGKTIAEAGAALDKALQGKGGPDERLLTNARYNLRQHASLLQERMEHHFAGYLERAMDTMYMDTRASIDEISADNLTLIEDDVVTRQIEIDRLVMRLRDADQPSLGRLNLMIAQLHGDGDVRERENPFRPYLLARSLHEALRQCVMDEAQSKVLFDTLSAAMVRCLQGYYVAIEEVFESRGISTKLSARPTALTRAQRDRLAWQKAAEQLISKGPGRGRAVAQAAQSATLPPQPKQARMIPELQRLMQQQRQAPLAHGSALVQHGKPDLQDMVWNVFNQPKVPRPPRHEHAPAMAGEARPRCGTLEAQLKQLQQAHTAQPGGASRAATAPLDLRAQLADAASSEPERVTIDLVSLLFESIVHDEQLPESVRGQLGRLHVPFLRAAMQEPSMLHDAQHPARRLLDRIGTVATGITPEMACYPALEQQIASVLDQVLQGFDTDMSAFAEGQRQLDQFVSALLPRSDLGLARCIDTLGTVEAASARHRDTAAALVSLLDALDCDPRIGNFLTDIWSRVLAHPASEGAAGLPMLAELVWTSQEKTTLEDRAVMVSMLPGMVKRVREGLAAAGMGDEAAKAALDRLVIVHMDVLGQRQPPSRRPLTLAQLRAHFAAFDGGGAAGSDAVSIGHEQLEAALAQRGIRADLYTDPGKGAARADDEQEWLGMALPGAGFEIALDGRYVPARLSGVSPRGSLYLFSVKGQAAPATFTRDALLAAMQDETLRTVEHAPVFERAVESLMAGAEALSNA